MSGPSHTIKAVLSEYAPDMYGITGPVCLSIWHLISMGTGHGVQVLSLLSCPRACHTAMGGGSAEVSGHVTVGVILYCLKLSQPQLGCQG